MKPPRETRAPLPVALLLVASLLLLAACGGGGSDTPLDERVPDNVDTPDPPVGLLPAPSVIGFSPLVRPFNPVAGVQYPRVTDPALALGAAPGCEGFLCVQLTPASAPVDPLSFYVGRDPRLGMRSDALSVTRHLPGVGHVPVPVDLLFYSEQIAMIPRAPYALPLPPGSYTIQIGPEARDGVGRPLTSEIVYHTFHVHGDTVAPVVMRSQPAAYAVDVPSGTTDILIHFADNIAAASLNAAVIEVERADVFPGSIPLPPAAGYPRLEVEEDGSTLPTNGHVVRWRARAAFPPGAIISVTVRGRDRTPVGQAVLADVSGNELQRSTHWNFGTAP